MRRHLFFVPSLCLLLAACGVGADAPTFFPVPNGGPADPVAPQAVSYTHLTLPTKA